MFYEIVNPSDACTLEAEDSLLASVVVIILSEGAYGLYDEDDRTVLPIFRFSKPESLLKWLHENGIDSNKMDEFYAKNGEEMAKILESIVYGKIADRKSIVALTEKMSPADRLDALAKWNDSKRSSMNDIAKGARELAKVFRTKAQELKPKLPTKEEPSV
jgi:hypothetical protein